MIVFTTPTAMPIEAATTMGVSVKEDGAIGKFGTGMKYAIAGVLRLGGRISVEVESVQYEFTSVTTDIRGRDFQIVHCNGQACGFTTELGKHWEPWQLFRELASNALDEGGCWSKYDAYGVTKITIHCREVEEAGDTEGVFLRVGEPILTSSMGATVYPGPSQHYYYKGIRAGSFPYVAPVTVDVNEGSLSEDRLLDLSKVRSELAWAFRTATHVDQSLALAVTSQSEPGQFWVDNICHWTMGSELPDSLTQFLVERPKWIRHPAFIKALNEHLRKGGTGKWQEVEPTEKMLSLLELGEQLCRKVGVDVVPRSKVRFTADLEDRILAVTCMDTRDVWFSTKLALKGRDEFLCGYLEEAIHAMTGQADCTRELQNTLFSIIVSQSGI